MGKPDGEVAVHQVRVRVDRTTRGMPSSSTETPSDIDAARNARMNCSEGAIQVEGR